MNQNYKTIFSRIRQCFVVVSELTKSHGKGSRASRVLCTVLLGACLAGVGQPAAWGATATNASVNVTEGSSDASSAWGINTSATGASSTAWGNSTTASGNGSTAWGGYTVTSEVHQGGTASGLGATAFGSGTWAEGTLSTAWGSGTGASGENATAWGYMTQATAAQATSWGANTSAGAAHATAWGNSTTASGEASTAFGYVGTKESGYDAPSIKATEIGTTAYGYATLGGTISAEGGGSTAFGSATMGGKISAGTGGGPNDKEGATAFGRAYGEKGQISATEMGATAFGAASDGTIKAEEWGATAFARTYDDGTISASGRGATAFGYAENGGSISAEAEGATAFGYAFGEDSKITASGIGSTAFGINTAATGTGAVAWGVGEKGTDVTVASGESSTAFGKSSQAWGDNSLAALGGRTGRGGIITDSAGNFKAAVLIDTNYNAVGAVAIGEGAVAEASHTYAIGKNAKVEEYTTENAIAFGNDSSVTEAGGVALGSKAVASVAAGVAGYDPATKAESTDTSGAWQSTHAAVSIGTADGSVTRQITGVAAGSKDTDAVNVAQLKAVAEADANTTYTLKQKTEGNQTKIVLTGSDGSPDQTATFEGGTGITITGDSSKATIAVDTVALKAAVDTNTTYQFETKAGDGSDNVVATTTVKSSTDGMNYTETGETFSDTDTKITSVAVDAGTKDASGKTTYTVTLSDNNENKTDSKLKATFAVTDTNTQSTVKHADSSKDYLTVTSADNSIGTKDYTVALTDKANTAIGNASTFLSSSGFSAGGGKVTVTDQGFAVQGGPSMTADGIDAGSKVISNVKAGEKDTDAVNVSQLNATNQKVESQDNTLRRLAHRDAQLERKIYRAGAHAAAIAALHPLDYDEDHKFTAAAGVGQYHGSSAMAVGAFYRPTENLMFSVGASLNENDSMVNAGMAYRFGTGSGNKTSPDNIHEMKRQISTLSEENRQLSAQLNSSETKLAAESERSARLEAEINKIKKLLKLK